MAAHNGTFSDGLLFADVHRRELELQSVNPVTGETEVSTRYQVKRGSPADIAVIAARLSLTTRQDGMDPVQMLLQTCALSRMWAARRTDSVEPVALWGAAILDREEPEVGTYWMLASDSLSCDEEQIFSLSSLVVDDMLATFEVLENHVDSRSLESLRLFARLGFTVNPGEIDYGTGCLLHHVRIERHSSDSLAH